jgi:hypothetical protein
LDQKSEFDAEKVKPVTEPTDEALSAIRQMIEDQDREGGPETSAASLSPDAVNTPAEARENAVAREKAEPASRRARPRRRPSGLTGEKLLPALEADDAVAASSRRPLRAMRARMSSAIREVDYKAALRRLRPRHVAVALLIVVMLWKPWLLPTLVFALFWICLIAWLTMGPDRASEVIAFIWERFARRFPDRAARWLKRIQAGADRIDGWLARLPERWTDGIYLPDLGRSQALEDGEEVVEQPDPFERLAAERQIGSMG